MTVPPSVKEAMQEYPIVRCGDPGHGPEPGYTVCVHISEADAAVASVIPATAHDLGTIRCGQKRQHRRSEDWHLVCACCARDAGWLVPA